MDKYTLALWIIIIGAVLTAVFLGYQSVSGGLLTQSTPPDYSPTLGPTSQYTRPIYEKLDSVYQDTAVASLDQIEVRPTPTGTPTDYTNAQSWTVDLVKHGVKHGGGSEVVDLKPNQYLHIGGTPPTGNQEWLSLADLQGAVILAEGGSIVFQEQPKRGLEFTIVAETSYPSS